MALLSVRKTALLLVAAVFLIAGAALAADNVFPPLTNWSAPATFSSHSASRGASTMGDISGALPFVAVTPCRQYDSRNSTPLPQNTSRAVTLTGAPCGLPTSAVAVSVNITIFNIVGATGNAVFQVGTATAPTFAWINFPQTETQRGNAGALPLGGSSLWVRVQMGAGHLDFTVDVNGYYPNYNINAGETFGVVANSPGLGVIFGRNTGTTSGSAGVFGVDGNNVAGAPLIGAGVRGENASDLGVWGLTNQAGGFAGVAGRVQDTAGNSAAFGALGYNFVGPHAVFGTIASTASFASSILGQDGAGVAGPTAGPTFSAGLIGHGRNGVIGRTSTVAGDGLIGVAENTAGTLTADGRVGTGTNAFVAVVGGYLGPTPAVTVDPHPTDASAIIAYTSLTGNEAGTYFRGTAQTIGRQFVINVPEDFRMVTDPEGLTVQLTPVGASASMYVVSEDLSQIVVSSSRDVKFHYLVQGVRVGHKGDSPIRESMQHPVFLPQGPDGKIQEAWPDYIKQRLIANGTYNPDGTINTRTAERTGWAQMWRESEEQSRAAAAKAIESREESQGRGKQ